MSDVRSLHAPPASLDAERAVLGAVLADSDIAWPLASAVVQAGMFYSADHRTLWEAVGTMVATGSPVDPITVSQRLAEQGDRCFALAELSGLVMSGGAPGNAAAYAATVRDRWQRRQVMTLAGRLGSAAMVGEGEAPMDVSALLADLEAVTSGNAIGRKRTWTAIEAYKHTLDAITQEPAHKPTGLAPLDSLLGGWHPGDFVVLGARPAMGKTALLLNLASYNPDLSVGIISAEQGVRQITARLMSMEARIPHGVLRQGDAAGVAEHGSKIVLSGDRLKRRNMWIHDAPAPTLAEVFAVARREHAKHPLNVLFVDYLQRLKGTTGERRTDVIEISQGLKTLALDLGITVVACAQVKRDVDSRPMGDDGRGRMPSMADMAESSQIEMEADAILTLYRPAVYLDPVPDNMRNFALLHCCKNRHGPLEDIALHWEGNFQKFDPGVKQ